MARKELDRLLDEVLGNDPKRALVAFRDLTERHVPWLEQRVVSLARRERMSWAVIGRLLGRSKQSVHERFATFVPTPAPQRLESAWDRAVREREEEFERLWNAPRHRPIEEDDPVAW